MAGDTAAAVHVLGVLPGAALPPAVHSQAPLHLRPHRVPRQLLPAARSHYLRPRVPHLPPPGDYPLHHDRRFSGGLRRLRAHHQQCPLGSICPLAGTQILNLNYFSPHFKNWKHIFKNRKI